MDNEYISLVVEYNNMKLLKSIAHIYRNIN